MYWHRNISEEFNINLQYQFVHMVVYKKTFIIQYVRYEYKNKLYK